MSRRFRVCDPNLPLLLPPSPQDWLPEAPELVNDFGTTARMI
jgi:hypothetical protein